MKNCLLLAVVCLLLLSACRPAGVDRSSYAYAASADPSKHYLFYLHGKIIEDQGLPAVSPDYGEYQYQAILEKFSRYGFAVISEQRAKDTDPMEYAQKIARQIAALLKSGIPAKNITVVVEHPKGLASQ
jgi:hypothetical protein